MYLMSISKKLALFVLAAAALASIPAFSAADRPKPGDAAQGQALYERQCSGCHAKDASGNTAMGKRFSLRDLRSKEVQEKTDAQIFDVIAKGMKTKSGSMPAYENSLGHDGIHNIIAYLRQLAKNTK